MANRKGRKRRSPPQAVPHKKKKKINWFRAAVYVLGVSAVVLVISGIANAVKSENAAPIGGNDSDPEFFSTIRPEATPVPQIDTIGSDDVPASEFDGVLFVGDSMTYQLEDYVTNGAGGRTDLRDAVFLTDGDYSWADALDEFSGGSATLWYGDAPVTLNTAIQQTQSRKLYIQLGKEDLFSDDPATVAANAQSTLEKLREEYPGLKITVQAVTPMLQWIDCEGLSSGTIAEYNALMKAYCAEEGLGFADIAAFFTEGYLPAEYCADPGGLCIHLNEAGCELWASYLLGEIEPEPTASPEDDSEDTETASTEDFDEPEPESAPSLDGVGRYSE